VGWSRSKGRSLPHHGSATEGGSDTGGIRSSENVRLWIAEDGLARVSGTNAGRPGPADLPCGDTASSDVIVREGRCDARCAM
jgi:hypothetical protein